MTIHHLARDSPFKFFFTAISIQILPSSTFLIGSDITISCIVNITIEVIAVQVVWTDQYFNPLNTIDGTLIGSAMDDLVLSLDLVISKVQVSNAGVYTCGTIINDTLGDSASIERQYNLTVESKFLFINND